MNKTVLIGKRLSVFEKEWFPWRKNRLISGQPAFFPGCNLVNFLPETTQATITLFRELQCGWLYECCSKPLRLAGNASGAHRVLDRIKRQLKEAAVTELVVACPNCYSVFRKELDIPVVDIYSFLKERNISCSVMDEILETFPPCPDRRAGTFRKAISQWTGALVQDAVNLPCCGLGITDPPKARKALDTILLEGQQLHHYCASCYGHLSENGAAIKPHILTMGLGLSERASAGIRKGFNRMKPWFWK